MLYNAVFTSWPCIATYIFERDCNYEYSMMVPQLYEAGHKKVFFNYKAFWKWILLALFHGAIAYFIPMYGLYGSTDSRGTTMEHWVVSTLSFSIILHVVTYKLYVDTYFWGKWNLVLTIGSLFIYYIVVGLGSIPLVANIIQPEASGVLFVLIQNQKFWFIIIITPFICLIPDVSIVMIQRTYFKNPSDIIASMQKNKIKNFSSSPMSNVKSLSSMLKPKAQAYKMEDWLKTPEDNTKAKINESEFFEFRTVNATNGNIYNNSIELKVHEKQHQNSNENLEDYRTAKDMTMNGKSIFAEDQTIHSRMKSIQQFSPGNV